MIIRLLFARKSSWGLRFIFFLVISILLMLESYRHSLFAQKWREGISLAAVPIMYIANAPFGIFDNIARNLQSRTDLLNENATLHATVMILRGQLQKLQALQSENKALRTLLQSSPVAHHLKLMLAEVLAVQISPYAQEIMINKGKKSGVFTGQAVLDGYGIMGQVIEAGSGTSRVLLITDPKSGIPIQNSRTGLQGILTGQQKSGLLKWLNISPAADIKTGDLLLSSGLGGRYPVGYPVGKVVHINRHTTDQFLQADVQPSAKINSSEQVLLVWNL